MHNALQRVVIEHQELPAVIVMKFTYQEEQGTANPHQLQASRGFSSQLTMAGDAPAANSTLAMMSMDT